MTLIPVPLGPQSDKAKSLQGGGARLTNCYVEKTDGGKTPYAIYTRPRLKAFADTNVGMPCRGAIVTGNLLYVVTGEYLYSITSGGAATLIGTVLGQKPVTMSVNRHTPAVEITITADTKNYVCTGGVLSEVTDSDLPTGVTSNCYINGRTIYGISDGRHYWSDDEASTSINALNFAEAEREADAGVRVFTVGEDFWHFGERTREIIRYTGNTASLFEPLTGAGQGQGDGCGARFSVASIGGVVYWVNDQKKVVASTGGKAQVVSDNDVSRDIESALAVGKADEITGFGVSTQGHDFYFLRCSLWCWMLDIGEGLWFRQDSYQSDTFRIGGALEAFNKTLALDWTDSKIYELSYDVEDDDGDPCIFKIETSPLNAYPDGYICDALHVDIQRGTSLVTGDSYQTDAELMLNVSRDGGMVFGNTMTRPIGRTGEYTRAVRFNRLGSSIGTGMSFRLSCSAPVERAIFQAVADVRKLKA